MIVMMLAGIGWVKITSSDLEKDKLTASEEFNSDQKMDKIDNKENQFKNLDVTEKTTLNLDDKADYLVLNEEDDKIKNQEENIVAKRNRQTLKSKITNNTIQESSNPIESKEFIITKNSKFS